MIESGGVFSAVALGSSMGAGATVAFVAIRWVTTLLFQRADHREAHADAGTQRLIEGLERRLDAESERGDRIEAEMKKLQVELRECERKHIESEQEVARLRGLMQGYGDAKQLAQLNAAADKARETKK
jgi:hypothetical protein